MGRKIPAFWLIIFSTGNILIAQHCGAQIKAKKLKFESYNATVWLAGQETLHLQIQSVNGISKGPIFLGAGLGLDFYRVRSVPLFLDFRYRFGSGKHKWFGYADAGYHIPWDDQGSEFIGSTEAQQYKGGFYYDAGIGYQFHLTKKGGGMFFSAGFSEKWISESATVVPFCPGPGPAICDPYTEYYQMKFRRFALKVGWKF